ncbi:MAG: hypothetical protein HPY69_02955 [Armatimonadetes bacterium]|nr:hypothetical protein [Armatimonadota bacterium]
MSTTTIGSASSLKLSGTAVEDANNADGDVDGIAGGSPVPDSNGVKTLTLNMKWEWSIDDGTSWASAGSISTIKMHYTEATPLDVDDLYDLALDKACGYVNGDADICGKISAGIDDDVWYDPGSPACNHTLDIYNTPSAGYMCCCHALLFPRLTRAIGVDATAKYLWGGHSATQACWFLVGTGGAATFRITRPSHEGSTEANPHFNWHAEVVSSGTYYDPSNGTTGLPSVSEMAPAHTPFAAAALQVDSQKFTTSHGSGWTGPH